jgi:hypothetical protein
MSKHADGIPGLGGRWIHWYTTIKQSEPKAPRMPTTTNKQNSKTQNNVQNTEQRHQHIEGLFNTGAVK